MKRLEMYYGNKGTYSDEIKHHFRSELRGIMAAKLAEKIIDYAVGQLAPDPGRYEGSPGAVDERRKQCFRDALAECESLRLLTLEVRKEDREEREKEEEEESKRERNRGM